jgi:nitroreductase
MLRRAADFHALMDGRRSVRAFSDEPVPRRCVELAIATAATAPSGANKQPWTWVVVDDPGLKKRIRQAAEEEERRSYLGGRMPKQWLEDLEPLGTDWRKPFLESAPFLVVCFAQSFEVAEGGRRRKHYYVAESVGIACGLFVAALHHMGLATLTHTPSPMGFLARILKRPGHERPYLLFPLGYPADGAAVPDIRRKPLREVMWWNGGEGDGGERVGG